MKKLIALFVALSVLCMAIAASAATVNIGTTSLKINIPSGFEQEELSSSDIEDGMTAVYISDNLYVEIYQEDADGYTLDDILAEIQEDTGIEQSGITNINGVDAAYCAGTETDGSDTYTYIEYCMVEGDDILTVVFVMADASASQTAADIMNSLSR